MRKVLVGALLGVYALGSQVAADDSKDSAVKNRLEEVVITGTRTEKLLKDSPVPVDIVLGEEVEAISIGTLEQVLNYIPGVYVNRSQKDGFNILMRGFDGDRVLVLVDGQRLISPTGASVDFAQISALDIARIEVVKGAASALYGSEAIGGVINIITRDDVGNRFKFSHESGAVAGNEVDGFEAQTSVLGAVSKSHWGVEAYFQVIDDPSFDPDLSDSRELTAEQEKTIGQATVRYRSEEINARYKYQNFTEDKYRVRGVFPGGLDDFYLSDVDKNTHSLIAKMYGAEIKSQFIRHEERSGNRGSLRDSDIGLFEFDSQYSWGQLGAEWVGGAHYYLDTLDQINVLNATSEVADESQDGVEAFIQGDWILSDSVELVVGSRVQNDSGYGSHTAFRSNVKYGVDFDKQSGLIWRTSFGDGYRVPTVKEQHYVFDHSNLGYMVLGNEDLLPEESLSLNTGIELFFTVGASHAMTAGLNVHYSDSKNFIDSVLNPQASAEQGLAIYEYQNIQEARISGADLDLSVKSENKKIRISYNYLDARDVSGDQRLEDRPYHQLKANFSYKFPKQGLDVLLYLVYQKDEAFNEDLVEVNNGFTVVNTTVGYQVTENFNWKVGAENLFDVHQDYDLVHGAEFDPRPELGRYMFVNFEFKID